MFNNIMMVTKIYQVLIPLKKISFFFHFSSVIVNQSTFLEIIINKKFLILYSVVVTQQYLYKH